MIVQAKGTEIPSSVSPSRFLITTIAGRYLAFDAEPIQGILPIAEAGYLHSPVVEGIVYRAVDLSVRLNVSNYPCVSVLLLAEQGNRASIRVEMVHGLLEIPWSLVLSLPAQFRGPEQQWYRGMILYERSIALVLNTTWLLDEQALGVDVGLGQVGMEQFGAVQEVATSENKGC